MCFHLEYTSNGRVNYEKAMSISKSDSEYKIQTVVLSMIYAFETQSNIYVKMVSKNQSQPYVLAKDESVLSVLDSGYYIATYLTGKKYNRTKENDWKALNLYYINQLKILDYKQNTTNFPILHVNDLNKYTTSKLGVNVNYVYGSFKKYVADHFRRKLDFGRGLKHIFVFPIAEVNQILLPKASSGKQKDVGKIYKDDTPNLN